MNESFVYNWNAGFNFRYRANVMRNIPGKGKFDDKEEQTFEIDGNGYDTMDHAIEAARIAKSKVWAIIETKEVVPL